MRNSSEIVAMKKLASEDIFDFTRYAVTHMGGDVIFERHFKSISLKEINNIIKKTISDTNARLNGLALGGHISTQLAHYSGVVSEKFFLVKNINELGEFDLGSKGLLYLRISTKNLSPEDLETVLGLGLELNKWKNYIKRLS